MDKEYIWFVGEDVDRYYFSFSAGTSIKYTPMDLRNNINCLDASLSMNDELRVSMIILAIKHGDTEMMTNLRAREIPRLYSFFYTRNSETDFDKDCNKDFLEAISNASDDVVEYFSEEFKIKNFRNETNTYIFPYIGNLIEILLKKENNYVEFVLQAAIEHNEKIYNKLKELLLSSVDYFRKNSPYIPIEDIKIDIKRSLDIFCSGDLICFYHPDRDMKDRSIISNIVCTKAESSNCKYNKLIEKLNKLYDDIKNIDQIVFK